MWTRVGISVGMLGLASGFALMVGCEDTEVTAPKDSTITVVASPASVNINQEAGQTRGDTTIIAQLLNAGGQPQSGVPLFFSSSGGLLGSVDNQCVASTSTCARTGNSCASDTDCPDVVPSSIETNSNGIATDVLTLRLSEDPDMVQVTVQSTVSSTMISVGTNVYTGPMAVITASPADRARTGTPITFSGFPQSGEVIRCWEWTIASSIPGRRDEVTYATSPTISRKYGEQYSRAEEQDLSVQLRVSGQSGVCGSGLSFSQFEDSISYQIRCDFTDPSVDAGPNQIRSLANDSQGGVVSIPLSALASDDDDPCLFYSWDCGTASSPPACGTTQDCCGEGAAVTCQYATEGTFTAKVTVSNRCGRIAQDNLTVQINP